MYIETHCKWYIQIVLLKFYSRLMSDVFNHESGLIYCETVIFSNALFSQKKDKLNKVSAVSGCSQLI